MKLKVTNLHFHYASTRQNDFGLHVDELNLSSGKFFGLVGPNGSGKSTLLQVLSAQLPYDPKLSSILWGDDELIRLKPKEVARKIAYVPTQFIAHNSVSLFQFILQGRFAHQSVFSASSKQDERAALESLEEFGLASKKDFLLQELSTGQQRLALLARALMQQPQALLLDETLSNLDIGYQMLTVRKLKALSEKGMLVLLVLHDLQAAAHFCPNLIWMKQGKVHLMGATKDAFTQQIIQEVYDGALSIRIQSNGENKSPIILYDV